MEEPKRRSTDRTDGRTSEAVDSATTRAMEHASTARFAGERREHLAYAPGLPDPPIPTPRRARILVVDDQPIVCTMVERSLTLAGYAVTSEGSARAALARLAETPDGFDLVITDTRMPEMNGWELIAHVRRTWPTQRLLRISGFYEADVDVPPAGLEPDAIPFLPKPFLPEELVRHVTTVLAA